MGAISASSVRWSKAQLQSKQPRVETTNLAAPVTLAASPSSTPSSSAPSSSAADGETLVAIMEQLQQMHANFGGHLETLTDEICQMNI